MARKPRVLDSWAMLAFFENEPAANHVEQVILDAHQADTPLLMSVVNVGELWYATARGHSTAEAEKALHALTALRITVVDADWEITRQAAAFKVRGKIAYADCFAAALAKLRKAELVTGDREFKLLEEEVKILWV